MVCDVFLFLNSVLANYECKACGVTSEVELSMQK